MKQLSRLGIQRMIDGVGSAGNGGGSVEFGAGLASMAWVDEKYLSKDFFLRLFGIHGTDDNDDPVDVTPNDMETTVTDIEAKLGFWSDSFVSAFGRSTGGGGGGGVTLYEPLNSINSIAANPTSSNRTLIWTGTQWTYSSIVTSVSMAVPTGFEVTGSPVSSTGTLALTFASGYSLPLTADVTKGVTAYGWGDHAQAGYALASNVYSKTEADNKFLPLSAGSGKPLTGTLYSQSIYPKNNAQYDLGGSTNYWRYLYVNRIYLASGVYLEYDSTNLGVHLVGAGFYSDSFVSAFGASTGGGGGITLNEPLNSINALNANPTSANKTLVWNGSAWTYVSVGSGAVSSITVGTTNYSPVGGVVTLPEYATASALSGYLPLTGGTLTGSQLGILTISKTGSVFATIGFYGEISNVTTELGYLGFSDVNNPAFRNTSGTYYKLWNEGNDGSGSGLDADLLDGNHGSYYAAASSLDNYLPLTGGTMTSAIKWGTSFNNSSNGWNEYRRDYGLAILSSTASDSGSRARYSCGLHVSGLYWFQLCFGRGYEDMSWRGGNDEGVQTGTGWRIFVDSDNISSYNAGSATKLYTARTLWGQSFDGTADVSGDIVSDYFYLRSRVDNPLLRLSVRNQNWYVQADSNGIKIGSTSDKSLLVDVNGNVSIGNVTPSYNLHVNGTLGVTGATTLSSTLSVASGITLTTTKRIYFGDSSHYIELDSTGFHFSHGLYSDSFVSAFGASSGGSSLSLNGVLSSINSSSLAAPSATGQTVVWDGTAWQYSTTSNVTLKADKIYASNGISISSGNLSLSNGSISLPGYINAYGNIITNSKIAIGYSAVSSSYQFYCKNNGYISGTLTQGSDIRRKNIVGDVDMLDINNVASAPIFRFTWKDRDDSHIYAGTSAQYWQDKLPETVLSTDEGYLSMDYGVTALIATIITAKKVVDHERRIRDLEEENRKLRKEIDELKAA